MQATINNPAHSLSVPLLHEKIFLSQALLFSVSAVLQAVLLIIAIKNPCDAISKKMKKKSEL